MENCCVCFSNEHTTNISKMHDSNNTAIISKLQSMVPEVEWDPESKMCLECLGMMQNEENVIEFKEMCLQTKIKEEVKDQPEFLFVDKVEVEEEELLIKEEHEIKVEEFEIETIQSENNNTTTKNKKTKSSKKTTKHQIKKHKNKKSETCDNNESNDNNDPPFKLDRTLFCEVCNKEFHMLKLVQLHCEQKHNLKGFKIKPYLCTKCNTRFTKRTSLLEHFRRHFKNAPVFICDICRKTFTLKHGLKKHIASRHMNERSFKCKFCKLGFNTRTLLNSHVAYKHSELEYQCDICRKGYSTKNGFNQHVNTHKKQSKREKKRTARH